MPWAVPAVESDVRRCPSISTARDHLCFRCPEVPYSGTHRRSAKDLILNFVTEMIQAGGNELFSQASLHPEHSQSSSNKVFDHDHGKKDAYSIKKNVEFHKKVLYI